MTERRVGMDNVEGRGGTNPRAGHLGIINQNSTFEVDTEVDLDADHCR